MASSASVHTDTVLSDDPPQLSATESSNPPQPALVRPENVHPMVTRAKAGIVQPRIHPSLLVHTEPKSVKQALQDTKWFAAMTDEFQALQKNNT